MKYRVTVEVDLGPKYDLVDADDGVEVLIPGARTLLDACPEGKLIDVQTPVGEEEIWLGAGDAGER